MESAEEQEKRARRRIRLRALVKASLLTGVLVFIVPAGGPWMSHEAFTAVMGRIMSSNWIIDILGHFVLAFVYGALLVPLIYKPPMPLAILIAIAGGFALYGLNYAVLGVGLGYVKNELHVALEHFMFGLFFVVMYRAMAVPPPRGAPPIHRSPAEKAQMS